MLDGAARLDDLFARTAELGMGAIAMTDHGNVFGAYDFWSKAKAHGIKPIIGIEAYFTPNTSRYDKKRVRWNDGGDDDVSGSRRLHPHDPARPRPRPACTTCSGSPAGPRWRASSTSPGPTARSSPSTARASSPPPAARPARCRPGLRIGDYEKARAGRCRPPGHPRQGQLLPRADGPRARHREPRPRRPPAALEGPRHPADRHQRLPLRQPAGRRRPRAPPLRLLGQACMSDPKRFRFNGDGYYLKSAAEMRDLWEHGYGLKEACDNTLLIAERCDVAFTEATAPTWRSSPSPTASPRRPGCCKEVGRGLAVRYPGERLTEEVRARAELRDGRHPPDGLPGYFLVVADFINWAKDNGIRVGPGRGSGAGLDRGLRPADHRPRSARARPALRAVPQSRAGLDARLRHRLRRASARRGDQATSRTSTATTGSP